MKFSGFHYLVVGIFVTAIALMVFVKTSEGFQGSPSSAPKVQLPTAPAACFVKMARNQMLTMTDAQLADILTKTANRIGIELRSANNNNNFAGRDAFLRSLGLPLKGAISGAQARAAVQKMAPAALMQLCA